MASFSDQSERNLPLLSNLVQVLQGLKESGLITERAGHVPSQPVYSITARGRELLRADVAAPMTAGFQEAAADSGMHPKSKTA